MKVSGVVVTYNEEKNIEQLIENLKDCDEIIIADDGSTDRTIEIAKSLGARVFRRNDHTETTTQEDIEKFTQRFGYAPSFTVGERMHNGGANRNEAASYAQNDWILMPDADERLSWDFDEIQDLTAKCDNISCDFVHSHNPDGSAGMVFPITKLYKKSVCYWYGMVHEVCIPNGIQLKAEKMKIDHYQDLTKDRSRVLNVLEFAVYKHDDLRSKFYLGREYFYNKRYENAIDIFNNYLKLAQWTPEIVEAMLFKAKSLWNIKQGEEARDTAMKALVQNPDRKALLQFLSDIHEEPHKSKWQRIADNAKNTDSLF